MPFSGPKWIPWIGNTYKLRHEARKLGSQHKVFDKWSKDYNSEIIGFKLGRENVVAVHGYDLVHKIHLDEVFEGRPDNFFLRLRTMGTRKGITCTDGPLWSEQRNFAVRHLRQAGYGKVQMDNHIRNECNDLIEFISNLNEVPTWPGTFLAPSIISVLWYLTASKKLERTDKRLNRLLELLQQRSKAFDMCGGMLTQMPWLRFIAPEKTGYNMICNLNKELHEFFMDHITEHKENFSNDKIEHDVIYAYINEMKIREGTLNNTFNDHQLTMTILDFFIAGSQTTSTTLDLAIMMLSLYPEIQDELRDEIASMVGEGIEPSYNNRNSFAHTEAFLMEVQRYFSIVPITGPRRALWDTKLNGYDIPKNTTILIGLRSVLMDKNHWKDPEVFRYTRFLNNDSQVVQNEYFMPFGQGKRRCLGDSLARSCLFTFFVGIIQNFNIQTPEKENPPSIDLLPGITLSPKPYKVVFKKRNLVN